MWRFPGCVNPNYVYEHTPPGTELYEDKKKTFAKKSYIILFSLSDQTV